MDFIEMTAKTADEAIEKALRALNASAEEVTVTVLEPGTRGFLGIGQKPAKVSVKVNFDPVRSAKKFIMDISQAMGLDIVVDAELTEKNMNIDLKGVGMGVLIGKHGSTLDSLQYLTNLVVNKNTENYVNIMIDTENYRKKRRETLESLARNMAKKVRQTRKPMRLEPMSPSERRVIHAALQGEKFITTYSEGAEPFRNVVIAPKRENYQGQSEGKSGRFYDKDKGIGQPPYNKFASSGSKPPFNKTEGYRKFIKETVAEMDVQESVPANKNNSADE